MNWERYNPAISILFTVSQAGSICFLFWLSMCFLRQNERAASYCNPIFQAVFLFFRNRNFQVQLNPFKSSCLQLEAASCSSLAFRSSFDGKNDILYPFGEILSLSIWIRSALLLLCSMNMSSRSLPLCLLSEKLFIPVALSPCIPMPIDKSWDCFVSLRNEQINCLFSLRSSQEVKLLSIEQSVGWFICVWLGHISGTSFVPENAVFRHWMDTFETNSESWTLAASKPTVPKFCFPSVSCAFSSTACRYFPWASILSCKCLCTCHPFSLFELQVGSKQEDGQYSKSFYLKITDHSACCKTK